MKLCVPHIVQYQGSKRKLAPQILKYMPLRFNRFLEPFSGMAAMSIATAFQGRATSYIINDINPDIISILRTAVDCPQILIDTYTRLWNEQFSFDGGSEAHYYHVRDEFNHCNKKASAMLYLLARCVKGSVRYNSNGEFNQSPDKRRHGTNPSTLASNVLSISYLLKGKASFYACDFREILDMAKPGDIVYMDPPYQGVSDVRDHRYIAGLSYNEFLIAVESILNKGIEVIISYDGSLGNKKYGQDLPSNIGLDKIELKAGISTQSLYLGRKEETIETLYVSHTLSKNIHTSHLNISQP